jgi:hypothetical protein
MQIITIDGPRAAIADGQLRALSPEFEETMW